MDAQELALENRRLDIEDKKLVLEDRKAGLDFRKAIWISVFAAIAIATIPPSFQLATAFLEDSRADAKLRAEQQQFRDGYIKEFLTTALTQDIELRLRFADYFASVSAKESRDGWNEYRKGLRTTRDQLRTQIDQWETELLSLQSQPTMLEGAEAQRLQRKLHWAYGEVGYAAPNRSVTNNPRAASPAATAAPARADVLVDNERLLQPVLIDDAKRADLEKAVAALVANRARYEQVGTIVGVPWYLVGILHGLEGQFSFERHLHNGDALTARTVNVPAGRPATGTPPFTWETSAIDALTLGIRAQDKANLGQVAPLLFAIERYNGLG